MHDRPSRSLAARLDRLHGRVRTSEFLYRFALVNRILLAMGFIPTGMVKVLGERFTVMPVSTPVGAFFEAMYQTGPYWRFIGTVQVLAGIFLLVPRLATLGAVMFAPIIANIFVITVSLRFQGTPFVTGAMVLSVTYLLCWDYDRLRGILFAEPYAPAPEHARLRVRGLASAWERGAYAVGTAAGMAMFAATRGFVPMAMVPLLLAVGAAAALTAAFALWSARRPSTAAQMQPTA